MMDTPSSTRKQDKVADKDADNNPTATKQLLEMERLNCNCDDSHDIYGKNIGEPVAEFIKHRTQHGTDDLEKDFAMLEAEENVVPCKASQKNEDKNRYNNIFCIENQRVILEGSAPYIHANFVHGYKHNNAFICTQAPTHHTTNDFWRMVWQEKCMIIVSLTKISEGNTEKCHKYWPVKQYIVRRYGKLKITNLDIESDCTDYDVTVLKVVHTKTREVRQVFHFLYLIWPDFGVPTSSFRFHKFTQEVHKYKNAHREQMKWWHGCPEGPPIIVHCSAGVGRTGTFCALHILTRKMMDTGKIDILHCIRALRRQRGHSVQKSSQYAFIFLALVEFAGTQGLICLKNVSLVNFVHDFTKFNRVREQALKVDSNTAKK